MTTQVLTQGDVEAEIMRLSALLETATNDYANLCIEEAKAEGTLLERRNTLLIHEANRGSQRGGARERDARVAMACKDEAAIHRIAEATTKAGKERLLSLRHQIDALRTISANIRAQT